MALLEVTNLGISFGGLRAVNAFDISIEKEELYGLIGPNGAGKTTVFNLLTGVYKRTAERCSWTERILPGRRRLISASRELPEHFRISVCSSSSACWINVKVGLHNKHHYSTAEGILRLPRYRRVEREMDEQAMELLKVFHLDQAAHLTAANLPYGEQRRLEIARALATEPKLLLLDEPAAGMNPNETGELMDMIRFVRENFHMTILLIEHDMKLVSGICEKLTVLNFGEVLAQGATSDVLNDPQVITAYLGE